MNEHDHGHASMRVGRGFCDAGDLGPGDGRALQMAISPARDISPICVVWRLGWRVSMEGG